MSDFLADARRMLETDDGKRQYRPVYVPEGDCMVYYEKSVPHHRVRLDGLVTVYVSDDDPQEVIGCQIKDISRMLRRYGSFGVQICQQGTTIGYLLMAAGIRPEGSELAKNLYESDIAQEQVELSGLCV